MFQKIFPGIFAFISQSEGSNCFLLLGGEEKVLVDSSTEDNKAGIISGLSALELTPKDISLIIHTHCHADHFGCDCLFPKAKVAMHEKDAKAVNAVDAAATCSQFFPGLRFPKITKTISHNQLVDLGGIRLRVVATPGHTAGSVCFLEEKQLLLFSGDTLFAGGFGRTDLPSGSSAEMAESLRKLQKLRFSLLLPGHGPLLRGAWENKNNLKLLLRSLETSSFL